MLQLENITFEAEGRAILKNVSLSFPDHKVIVITGPNGSGKSTLARIIAGITQPTSGRIVLNGEDITNLSITERAQKGIGFAFQQPVRFKGITVNKMLSLAAGKALSRSEACNYLSQVGLCANDYVDRELNQSLSGGEIKRIEIAMLVARNIKFAIFDEPEAGIDLWSFQNLIDVFRRVQSETGASLMVISHQERILDIADHIVVLTAGEITAEGSKEELMPQLLSDFGRCDLCSAQGGKVEVAS